MGLISKWGFNLFWASSSFCFIISINFCFFWLISTYLVSKYLLFGLLLSLSLMFSWSMAGSFWTCQFMLISLLYFYFSFFDNLFVLVNCLSKELSLPGRIRSLSLVSINLISSFGFDIESSFVCLLKVSTLGFSELYFENDFLWSFWEAVWAWVVTS